MKTYHECIVTSNQLVAPGITFMELYTLESIAPKPGQFAMIRVAKTRDPFLARPLSIMGYSSHTLKFLFRVTGRGTGLMSEITNGYSLEVLMPLGNPFPEPQGRKILALAGGVGLPPLYYYKEEHPDETTLLLGVKSASALPALPARPWIPVTEDGSAGLKGRVTDVARQMLQSDEFDAIYACGPLPMLAEVKRLGAEAGLPTLVSLEARMACGVGVCHGCAHPLTSGEYAKVCTHGPVFEAGEVVL